MIACFLSTISAKYYKNPSMLSRVIAENVGDVFFETQCICLLVHCLTVIVVSTYTTLQPVRVLKQHWSAECLLMFLNFKAH